MDRNRNEIIEKMKTIKNDCTMIEKNRSKQNKTEETNIVRLSRFLVHISTGKSFSLDDT